MGAFFKNILVGSSHYAVPPLGPSFSIPAYEEARDKKYLASLMNNSLVDCS